jgi:hypothetical protein
MFDEWDSGHWVGLLACLALAIVGLVVYSIIESDKRTEREMASRGYCYSKAYRQYTKCPEVSLPK